MAMLGDEEAKHREIQEAFTNGRLSNVNGAINRMKKDDIRVHLKLLGLDDRLVNFD